MATSTWGEKKGESSFKTTSWIVGLCLDEKDMSCERCRWMRSITAQACKMRPEFANCVLSGVLALSSCQDFALNRNGSSHRRY